MRIEKKQDTTVIRIESMTDLGNYLDTCSGQDAQEEGNDFFRDGSYTGAIELMKTGWKAGTGDVMARLDNLKTSFEMERSGYFWATQGMFFDVGAVLSGEPEHWMDDDYQPTRKFVKIVANVAASGGVNADHLRSKGAAILALVDYLQSNGFIVELEVITGAQRNGKRIYTVQSFGTTPLDWDAASFALAHGAYFRRLTWTVLGAATNQQYLGSHSCFEPEEYRNNPNIIYIPSGDMRRADGRYFSNLRDSDAVAQWVSEWAEKALTLNTEEAEAA